MALNLSDPSVVDSGRDVAERVERIVGLRTAARIRNLHVDVQGTDVILTGVAPTYYVKQLATHAALDEIERRTLTNDIEVG